MKKKKTAKTRKQAFSNAYPKPRTRTETNNTKSNSGKKEPTSERVKVKN